MKTKILIVLLLFICLFAGFTLYQYYNEDLSKLEAARAASDSLFIDTESGRTRYKVFGNENSETVILVHSFNGFIESWNPNIDALVAAGYRVVAYDLYGRGLSDRPYANYDLALFRKQLSSVVDHLGLDKVHLIGSSFGCVIASDYALNKPNLVESLIMVGPAGWPVEGARNPLLDVPVVGDLAFHYFGIDLIKPKVEAYLVDQHKHADVLLQWGQFANYPGYTRSALSTIRNAPVFEYTDGWQQLATLNKPTMFIWGKQDVSFPFNNTEKLAQIMPQAKIVGVDNAAHWVNVEQADVVNTEIISFLKID